jgi:hypothetical protein
VLQNPESFEPSGTNEESLLKGGLKRVSVEDWNLAMRVLMSSRLLGFNQAMQSKREKANQPNLLEFLFIFS